MIRYVFAAVVLLWTVAALTYPAFTRITPSSLGSSPRRRHPAV